MTLRSLAVGSILVAFAWGGGVRPAPACNASCPEPYTCSCSAGPCPPGTVESCGATCAPGFGCLCSCVAVAGPAPPSQPRIPRYEPDEGMYLSLGDTVTLNDLGSILWTLTGWGVVISGSGSTSVDSGSWTDTVANVVDAIGEANDFSASWDDEDGVLTLTVD